MGKFRYVFYQTSCLYYYCWPHSLYSGDIDQDGDLDLFSTSNNDISWWENDGSQVFTQHTLLYRSFSFTKGFIRYIYALDLNNDTFIDFISGDNIWGNSSSIDTIYYWLNDGNQVFTQKTVEGLTYAQFHGFDVVDLDKDGDLDFCATSPDQNQIDWFENDGKLNFTQHTITTSFNGANDVHTGDVDKDGDLDLITAAYYDDKISWWENDGNQYFTERVVKEDFNGAHFSMFSDINKDGNYDIIGLAWEGDELSWWEQVPEETSEDTSTTTFSTDTSTTNFGIDLLVAAFLIILVVIRKKKTRFSPRR